MRVPSLAAALLVLSACSPPADQPVDPVWGKQPCDHCKMLVSEPRPSAQAVVGKSRRFFDDIGCLIGWMEASGEQPEHVWVRAATGNAWVDALAAKYKGGHRTPMDYGFLAETEGISFAELRELVKKRDAERGGGH